MIRLFYAWLLAAMLNAAATAQGQPPNPLPVNGRVLDAEGRPVAGFHVSAVPADKGLRGVLPRAYTDAAGKFSVTVRQTGWFRVGGSKPAEGHAPTGNPFYHPSPDAEARVFVRENGPAPFVTLRLRPKAGTLVGVVTDAETGRPVTSFWVSLCRAEAPKYCRRLNSVNTAGRFTVLVPPEPVTVQVSAGGYKDWVAAGDGSQPAEVVRVDAGGTKGLAVAPRRPVRSVYAPAVPELEAPLPLLPVEGAELMLPFPRETTLTWSPVPGASSYAVEVEFCMPGGADGRQCVTPHPLEVRWVQPQAGIVGTSYTMFMFPGAQPGRWRVWAADASGRPGAKSAWANFNHGM